MNLKLKEKVTESLSAILPITAIVLLISIFITPVELDNIVMFTVGAVMLVFGMGFFQFGAEMAMTPLGEGIGASLSKTKSILITIIVSLIMGILITIAEPDLQVLATQVPSVPNLTLILSVALGVGIFLVVAVLRTRFHINLSVILIVLYAAVLALSFFVPKDFLSVAFDSGGVTTGPITVPFIMAFGFGIASMEHSKDSTSDSFGLVALSSVGPILSVLILGCFFSPKAAIDTMTENIAVATTRDVAKAFAYHLPKFAREVALSLLPIIAVFAVFQLISRRYNKHQMLKILVGFVYTFIGLVLFLCGVNVGFAPVGSVLGENLMAFKGGIIIIPIGILIGYYMVKAEPAIQILNTQIHTVTNGTISEKAIGQYMSVGVAVSVGISMIRIITGLPLQWVIVPGYAIALVMSLFVPKIFVGIAFDSGGVASGPMATTFLLPMAIGACKTAGGDLMADAFGVVALVALTPLIAIQFMGLQYKIKSRKVATEELPAVQVEHDEIIELEED